MNLSPHFTLEEFCVSEWAARAGVSNIPDSEALLANLKRTAAALEVARYALGAPITVTSGYRSPEVNRAVGGVSTSAHQSGCAVDFICPGFGSPLAVAQKLMSVEALEFDQLIHEYGRWVHLGVPAPQQTARYQALSIFRPGRYLPGILDKEP